jgi:hypothetical protein
LTWPEYFPKYCLLKFSEIEKSRHQTRPSARSIENQNCHALAPLTPKDKETHFSNATAQRHNPSNLDPKRTLTVASLSQVFILPILSAPPFRGRRNDRTPGEGQAGLGSVILPGPEDKRTRARSATTGQPRRRHHRHHLSPLPRTSLLRKPVRPLHFRQDMASRTRVRRPHFVRTHQEGRLGREGNCQRSLRQNNGRRLLPLSTLTSTLPPLSRPPSTSWLRWRRH